MLASSSSYSIGSADADHYRRQQIDKIAAAVLRRRDGTKLVVSAVYEIIRTVRETATQDKPYRQESVLICRGAVLVFESLNYRFMFPAYVEAIETVIALLEAEKLDDIQAYNDDIRGLQAALGGSRG